IDRTISYTKHEVGRVNRLTVAVAIDDKAGSANGEGNWSAEEIQRLTLLVRDAVGFDAARGDSVNLVNSAFFNDGADAQAIEPTPWYQIDAFQTLIKWALALLALLAIVFGVLRPVMKSLSQSAQSDPE